MLSPCRDGDDDGEGEDTAGYSARESEVAGVMAAVEEICIEVEGELIGDGEFGVGVMETLVFVHIFILP